MVQKVKLDDQAVIQEALKRMQMDEPKIPAEKVRKFMSKLGEELQRTGELRAEFVDALLKQLHDGAI